MLGNPVFETGPYSWPSLSASVESTNCRLEILTTTKKFLEVSNNQNSNLPPSEHHTEFNGYAGSQVGTPCPFQNVLTVRQRPTGTCYMHRD